MNTPTSSTWIKYLSQPGHIRAVSVDATDLVHVLFKQQALNGRAQHGYAEAVVGTLLIASAHKSTESINMNAQGSTLYRQALIDATPDGKVRGFLNLNLDAPAITKGGPWGTGVLSILHTNHAEGKAPYTGMVGISTGFLDEAINDFYRDSEQLDSKVGLHVEFRDGHVVEARGALVQTMGGATDEERALVRGLELADMRELANGSREVGFAAQLAALLPGREFKELEVLGLSAFCTCGPERIERALTLTGETDALEALGDDPEMKITCDFCRQEYALSAERVRALFQHDPSRIQ